MFFFFKKKKGRHFRKCNKINQTSTGRGKTGASVTDKLDMSQMSVATKKRKKLKSKQVQKLEAALIEAWYLDQEDDCPTLPYTCHVLS